MVSRLATVFALIGLAACSGGDRLAADQMDPFESVNRKAFAFNMKIDDIVLEPAAKGFRMLPDRVQDSATNFANWTGYPSTAVNSALQGKFENAALAMIHFLVNGLTLGLADLTGGGDDPEDEDFGQTLARWSMPSGPYIMMPIMGPGTVRSHTGWLVDTITDPLGRSDEPAVRTIMSASAPVGIVAFRGNNFEQFNEIKYNSADPYARTRSIYLQYREGQLHNGETGAPSAADDALDTFLDEEDDE